MHGNTAPPSLQEKAPSNQREWLSMSSKAGNPHEVLSRLFIKRCHLFAKLPKVFSRYSLMDRQEITASANLRHALKRLLRHPWALAGVSGVALLGMVTASAIAPQGQDTPATIQTVLERLAMPTVTPVDSGAFEYLREEIILRSDTMPSLLSRLGITDPDAIAFLLQNNETKAIARQLRPGKTVSAKTGPDGELLTLFLPLNGKDATLVVERTSNGFSANEKALRLTTQSHFRSGEIASSLFGATDAAGIPDAIAVQLAEIFSGDIDFYRDLRKGDRFTIVYESLTHQGQPVRSGRILAAEFVNNNKTYQAYWFETEEGKGGYYSADGKSLRKAFLRSPLEFSRVTSGFSNARLHPVLNITRAHKGIDYGAPTGTRVRAVADASVEFAGRQGGYGNLIVLKHQGAYSTAYGHLNGFAPGIRKGARVSQGDTIGFVGQTGIATGPHLHYEFRINSQQVNPMALTLPDATPLNASTLQRFKLATESLRPQLDLAKQIKTAAFTE